jgi:folate-binding protein YgfZ
MATTLQSAAIPTSNPDSAAQLSAILTGAAIAPLIDRAFLRITGPDAPRWLNGMVTNDIQSLKPGEGNYNFLLNAQGRILGDCTIYRDPAAAQPEFFLETDKSQIDTIHQHLDKFIIMDDVELAYPVVALTGIALLGPNASHPLVSAAHSPLPALGGSASTVLLNGHQALILTPPSGGVPVYEVWFDSAASDEHSFHTFKTAVGIEVSSEALEHLRILSGTPRYGIDIRNSATAHDLPQETAPIGVPHRALHFTKGCYLGQEIVERIRSRGNVHRTFAGFQLTGPLPLPGTALQAEGKPVGELTSVATIPLAAGPVQFALGYIRREALQSDAQARKLPLEYPGGTATPSALPFAVS